MKTTPDEGSLEQEEQAGETRKQARRREKAEARLRRLGELPPEPRERFRILTDCISEARQVVNLSDHRARYSLIIIGVLNAGVFAAGSEARLLTEVSAALKPWLAVVLVIYGLLNLSFVLFAIDSLRPRPLAARPESLASAGAGLPGLLFWEAVSQQSLERYHETWDQVRMAEINREAETIFFVLAHVVQQKHQALRRLNAGLVALVIYATLLLAAVTWFAMR